MQFVDSHCHINFPPLAQELPRVLNAAAEQGIAHLLCVAVNLHDYPAVRELAHTHPNVFASVGVHPNERDGAEPTVAELVALAQDPRVVAIGETGLDYYRSEGDLSWQHERFRRHIRAAIEVKKPLIVHTREAKHDTLAILEEEGAAAVGGVMHCFSEDWKTAERALALDFYISFSGIVTFKSADALRAVAARVPEDRLLIETDSPYLAPVPHRGKTNEPAYVRHVAECLAEVRGQTLAQIAALTTANFFRLFRFAQAVV